MKIFIILTVTISFFSCAKKQIPQFLNFKNQSNSTKINQSVESLLFVKNTIIEDETQKLVIPQLSAKNDFKFEDFSKENSYYLDEQITTPKPIVERKKVRKLAQIMALKKSISKEKRNYEQLNETASTYRVVSMVLFFLTLGLGSLLKFSQFGVLTFFILVASILAYIGLTFGIISLKKAEKKGPTIFGIFISLLWSFFLTFILVKIW